MSREGLVALVDKVLSDEAFLARLKADPDHVLGQFDLNEEERAAIKSGDHEELRALGLDERLSK